MFFLKRPTWFFNKRKATTNLRTNPYKGDTEWPRKNQEIQLDNIVNTVERG